MPVICIASAKGGVGKTTLTMNLASLAAEEGRKPLIVDLDAQRSCYDWRVIRSAAKVYPRVVAGEIDKLGDLIAAAQAERLNPVFIDTPPHATEDIFRAARASDLVLVPIRPGILDIRSAGRTLDALAAMKKPYAVVLNACPPSARGEPSVVRESREVLAPHPVAPMTLSNRVAFSYAAIDGSAVTEFEPDGRAAAELRDLADWTRTLVRW